MMVPYRLDRVTAEAVVPEQVVAYVRAVAESKPRLFGSCVGYQTADELVLVGYPLHDPMDGNAMAESVKLARNLKGLRRITVIGAESVLFAPDNHAVSKDYYYGLPIPPPPPPQKVRNLLRRAGRELTIDAEQQCSAEHLAIIQYYLEARPLAPGTRHIFRQLPAYLSRSDGSLLLSARLADGRLAAFAVGEFAALRTAFYLFSFRDRGLAPPGSADLLLSRLLDAAEERGQQYMNLGLGINERIRFFKRKWGAAPFLPYVETVWETRPYGFFSRLRSLFNEGTRARGNER